MQWEEPDVAVPVPAHTGQPMEQAPDGTRKRRKRVEDAEEDRSTEATAAQLEAALQTGKTETLSKESTERIPKQEAAGRRSSRRRTMPVSYREVPPSPEPHKPEEPEEAGETNRVALSEPVPKKPKLRRTRRQATKSLGPMLSDPGALVVDENGAVKEAVAESKKEQLEASSKEFCAACGQTGQFICCDNCPRRFHLLCLDPPLTVEELPEGSWYCRECEHELAERGELVKSEKGKAAKIKKEGDPAAATGEDAKPAGEAGDVPEAGESEQPKKSKKRSRKKKEALTPQQHQKLGLFGELLQKIEHINPRSFCLPRPIQLRYEGVLADENGDYVNEFELNKRQPRGERERDGDEIKASALCYRCSESARAGPLLKCDKCPAHWHVDCLNPPQFSFPARWLCPLHVEHAARLPRKLRNQRVKDTFLRRGHKNNGLIEVYDDELPSKAPSLIGNVVDTEKGFKAVMTHKEPLEAIYRLPAREIKLDFIDFVHAQWEDPWRQTQAASVLGILNELAEQPQPEREATRNLMHLKLQHSGAIEASIAKKNMEQLVDIALDNNDDQQVLAIRQLLQAKGRDKLLKFLTT